MRTKTLLGLFVLMILAATFFVPATNAEDFTDRRSANRWKLYEYHHRPRFHGSHPYFAPHFSPPGIAFDFLDTPDTAFLVTSHPYYDGDLLGDLTGKTLVSYIEVNVTPGTVFTYFGEPDGCVRPANVSYYFETDTSGRFEETDYWWTSGVDLNHIRTTGTVFVAPGGSYPHAWRDDKGHPGDFDAAHEVAFNAAARDARRIGMSFNGGCSRGNGVGIVPGTGSGSFTLGGFSATPDP